MLKTFFIRTYGCQMNELDSELVTGILLKRGLTKVDDEALADLLLYNTCSVRDLAERKILGKLGLMGRGKKKALIGVMGCMVMTQKEKIFKKFPHVDFIIAPHNVKKINAILDEVIDKSLQIPHLSPNDEFSYDYSLVKRENPHKAFVSITRGCNNFCSYCIVPFTRGREISRHYEDIIKECNYLCTQGYQEITLLGQNVNSYGKDHPEWKVNFSQLLELVSQTPIKRIRFLTSNPHDITEELMYTMQNNKKICHFLHFPMQSGSNKILKLMNRKYTKEDYLEKVKKLKQLMPDIKLGTDIIVGFPQETEKDFLETYEAFEEVGFQQGFIFAYSPRKNTKAYDMEETVSKEEKNERLQRLLTLLEKIQIDDKKNMINQSYEVLVDGKFENTLKGKTHTFDKVVFTGPENLLGTLQKVKIENFSHDTLIGKLL
jgi:tRNA-2-methylthio-N6-dimethylallyladenosine synthase